MAGPAASSAKASASHWLDHQPRFPRALGIQRIEHGKRGRPHLPRLLWTRCNVWGRCKVVAYRLDAEQCRCWLAANSLRLRWRRTPTYAVQLLSRSMRVEIRCRHHIDASEAHNNCATLAVHWQYTNEPMRPALAPLQRRYTAGRPGFLGRQAEAVSSRSTASAEGVL